MDKASFWRARELEVAARDKNRLIAGGAQAVLAAAEYCERTGLALEERAQVRGLHDPDPRRRVLDALELASPVDGLSTLELCCPEGMLTKFMLAVWRGKGDLVTAQTVDRVEVEGGSSRVDFIKGDIVSVPLSRPESGQWVWLGNMICVGADATMTRLKKMRPGELPDKVAFMSCHRRWQTPYLNGLVGPHKEVYHGVRSIANSENRNHDHELALGPGALVRAVATRVVDTLRVDAVCREQEALAGRVLQVVYDDELARNESGTIYYFERKK